MAIQTLDPRLVDSLQQSARDILESMVSMVPQAVTTESECSSSFEDEVIGLLGFTGTRCGTFVIRTAESLAKAIAAKMLMMEPGELQSFAEASDAFGEVVNMLGGNFKNAWVEQGNRMELSVPNVIHRGNVRVKSDRDGSLRTRVRVTLPDGTLDIGVHFEPQN